MGKKQVRVEINPERINLMFVKTNHLTYGKYKPV